MYEAAASCKDIARAHVTNWEHQSLKSQDNVTPWGTGGKFSSYLRIVSVTCNDTSLRNAVMLQVCTHFITKQMMTKTTCLLSAILSVCGISTASVGKMSFSCRTPIKLHIFWRIQPNFVSLECWRRGNHSSLFYSVGRDRSVDTLLVTHVNITLLEEDLYEFAETIISPR